MLKLLLLFTLFSNASWAEELFVVSDEWKNSAQKDGSGLFFDIVREVYQSPQYTIKTSVYPYKRTVEMVKKGDAHIVLGPYAGELSDSDFILPKVHLFVDDIMYIYYKPNTPIPPKNYLEVISKPLGWYLGYGYEKYMPKTIKFREYRDSVDIAKVLERGKSISYFIIPDALIDRDTYPKAKFGKEHLMWVRLFSAFQNSSTGKKLVNHWDKRMPHLIKDGTIKKLFKKWNLEEFYLYDNLKEKGVF